MKENAKGAAALTSPADCVVPHLGQRRVRRQHDKVMVVADAVAVLGSWIGGAAVAGGLVNSVAPDG